MPTPDELSGAAKVHAQDVARLRPPPRPRKPRDGKDGRTGLRGVLAGLLRALFGRSR
jgi:hypothetical protein